MKKNKIKKQGTVAPCFFVDICFLWVYNVDNKFVERKRI